MTAARRLTTGWPRRSVMPAGQPETPYEKFRSEIPPGKKGWGASGKLDLDLIRKMASA